MKFREIPVAFDGDSDALAEIPTEAWIQFMKLGSCCFLTEVLCWQTLFGQTNLPHGRYDDTLTRSILQWQPRDDLEGYWSRL